MNSKYSPEDLANLAQPGNYDFTVLKNRFKSEYALNCPLTGSSFFFIFDLTKMAFLYVSPSVQAITGYSSKQFMDGGLIFTLSNYHPDDALRHKIILQEMMSYNDSLPINDRCMYRYSSEFRLRRVDGRYIRLLDQHTCFLKDEEGHPLLDFIVYTDITFFKTDNRIIFTISKYDEEKKEFIEVQQNYLPELKDGILSKREVEILDYINLGLSNKEMSDKMFLSLYTIETHRKNIKKKTRSFFTKLDVSRSLQ